MPVPDQTFSSMQAQVLHAVGDMRYETIARPEPAPGQVLVRIAYCGICGSDIPRVFVKGTYHFPTVIGHEFAGTVAACGPGVDDLEPGQAVAVFPLIWCGHCSACEQGRYAQCLNYDYLGSRSDGGLAEYVIAPRQNLLKIPDSVSLAEAAMTEPAAVALHALRRAGEVVGQTVAIFGAGPIGLKECFVTGSHGSTPRHHEMAVQLLEKGLVRVEPLITHHFPLTEIKEGFQAMESRTGMKIVIRPQG